MPSLSTLLHHITLFVLKIQRGCCDQEKALPLRAHHAAWAGFSPTYLFCQKFSEHSYTRHFCGPPWKHERPVNYFCWAFCLKANHEQQTRSCSAWILPSQSVDLYCLGSSSGKKQLLKLHATDATSNNCKHILIKFTCPIWQSHTA